MAENNARNINVPDYNIPIVGDVTGDVGAATVVALQGIAIKSGTPSDGQVLTYVGADSKWEAVNPPTYTTYYTPASVGPLVYAVRTGSTNTTIASTDCIYVNTGSSVTLTLPALSPVGQILFIKNLSSTTMTIQTSGTSTMSVNYVVHGSAIVSSIVIPANSNGAGYQFLLCYDGINWMSFGGG